jgi:hypothetical protein
MALPAFITRRTIVTDIIQGIIVGAVLAFITVTLLINHEAEAIQTTVNGWSTTLQCNEPGNGVLLEDACAKILPAANVALESAYWTTIVDSTGQTLSGEHAYILHFPKGQLPPNHAFWSLTLTDLNGYMVANPTNRYSVNDQSNLVSNVDGSIDIYIQSTAPAGHESNWLSAPSGDFKLWLRAYVPDQTILNGEYVVPPVVETK